VQRRKRLRNGERRKKKERGRFSPLKKGREKKKAYQHFQIINGEWAEK